MSRPKWKFYTGDLNWLEYGGTWLKRYEDYFEFTEIWRYDGDKKYIMFHSELSLDDIALTRNIMGYAMQYCGMEFDENHDPADLAYALFCYDRHDDVETGNNARKLLKSWGIHRP